MRALLDLADIFHFWMATVLAIGLSKLSGAPVKESVFGILGYWIFARLALVTLA